MKNTTFSITLILGGFGLLLVSFVSLTIAIPSEILFFWQVAWWTGPLGIVLFFTGEHLRSKILKPPPTKYQK